MAIARTELTKAIDAMAKWPDGVPYSDQSLKQIESAARALRGVPLAVREKADRLVKEMEK